jgi:hypothetical protein
MKIYNYVSFQQFYSFNSYIEVFGLLWVNFCILCEIEALILWYVDTQCSSTICWKNPPLNDVGTLENQFAINVWIYVWTLNSIQLSIG